jgi:tetratricopeptide (TPR) repeat protein
MIPGNDQWTVILNGTWSQWGAYHYDSKKDILRLDVKSRPIDHVELCTFNFTELTKSKGILNLEWENTRISIPIETDSHQQTLGEIKKAMHDSRAYWYTYSAAAQYHFYEYQEAEIALAYVEKAIALEAPNPAPWMLKSQILSSLGRYQEAIAVAEEAIEICKKEDFEFEIHENEENIRKWKEK